MKALNTPTDDVTPSNFQRLNYKWKRGDFFHSMKIHKT